MAASQALTRILPLSLLASLLYAPPAVLESLLASTKSLPLPHWAIASLRPTARILLALGLARALNAALASWAQNNWRLSPHPDWTDWTAEVAVVTGGCQGIGRSIAEGLASRGVRVAVLDVQDPPAEMLVAHDKRIHFFRCDVSSFSAVGEAGVAVREALGDPTILVNNAGVARRDTVLEKPEEDLKLVVGVNLMSLWWTTKTFLPASKQPSTLRRHLFFSDGYMC